MGVLATVILGAYLGEGGYVYETTIIQKCGRHIARNVAAKSNTKRRKIR